MATWNLIYRCKHCDSVYRRGEVDEIKHVGNLKFLSSDTLLVHDRPIMEVDLHLCSENSFGLAEFIGVSKLFESL